MIRGWFGPPGAVVPVPPCRDGISESGNRAATERIAFSGTRHLQVGGGSVRSWDLSVAGTPAQLAPLKFASTTAVPWVWVSPSAQASNLLTPGQSMFADGEVTYAGGASARSGVLMAGDTAAVRWAGGPAGSAVGVAVGKPVPVIVGVRGTGSGWSWRTGGGTCTRRACNFLESYGTS